MPGMKPENCSSAQSATYEEDGSSKMKASHRNQCEEIEQNFSLKTEENPSRKKEISTKKSKTKKNKKGETDTQNISVKSSFSKFDAIQKRNLIHNPQGEVTKDCHVCKKAVYKMEEIKAEKNIYHKNCFRCNDCNKQLKVDSYLSHEGVLYCIVHFKLLFAPKSVEDTEVNQPRKPELIIRENQPTELPPDVVRASDKPNLGLEELQQLNVRSRFQVFEQGKTVSDYPQSDAVKNSNNVVRRSSTILSKVAKLQQLGSGCNQHRDLSSSIDNDDADSDTDSENCSADLIQKEKCDRNRELPVGIGEAMNDIRTLFENGHGIRKEERREERKQEIQNIRSRLFLGKQARIKEMYQQAVAESENANDTKTFIEVEVDSKSLRERFENGEIFRENHSANEQNSDCTRKPAIEKEADVFESAISKNSRSIFMELDANLMSGKNQNIFPVISKSGTQHKENSITKSYQNKNELETDVVKCDETVEDVKIQTAEISEKFKFFEKYHPQESKKKVFRITPPREGVVKMPSPEKDENENKNIKDVSADTSIITQTRTASVMLNKFRELEKNANSGENNSPKPLKCFTPPPDGNRRLYCDQESDEFGSNDEEEDGTSIEDEDENNSNLPKDDEALKEAQNAARAKQLRIKFEKWQAEEIQREKSFDLNHSRNTDSDENSIESTQLIRERFEKMKNTDSLASANRPRYQVNRFV